MSRVLPAALLGVLFLAFSSCSPSTPRILQDFSRLTYLQDAQSSAPREALSLFLHVENKDGLEDLEKVYILSDKTELYWTLEPGQWQRREWNGEVWIGSNFLFSPLGEVPRGEYRIVLQSKSGERARTLVYLDSPSLSEYNRPLPKLTMEPEGVTVQDPPEAFELWVASADGQPLFNYKSRGESRISAEAFLPTPDIRQRARQLTFHRFEDRLGVSLILGPYPISF